MNNQPNPMELFSPFLPTTYNIPEEDDRRDTFLLNNFSIFADVVNDKKIGVIVDKAENFSGGKWWYKNTQITRNEFQTIAYIPSFPNTTTLTLTLTSTPGFPIQNINPEFVVTLVYGSASKPSTSPDISTGSGDYFSFFSKGDSRISFTMNSKQIVITTTTDLSAYSGFIVINYIRRGV